MNGTSQKHCEVGKTCRIPGICSYVAETLQGTTGNPGSLNRERLLEWLNVSVFVE